MRTAPWILGLSAFYHDSAAALIRGGEIIAAAQQERFSRRKNDEGFPQDAIDYCLRKAGISTGLLDAVAFYDKPIVKFTRMLETYLAVAPQGWQTFIGVLPGWIPEKLDLRGTIRRLMPGLSPRCELLFTEHHEAHAASAFHPSPFNEAAILTVDGVGEWATTVIGNGSMRQIELLKEIRFPHSLGLLYSAFTAYCGFRINSGEYKLMGLAPYGEPKFTQLILDELIDLKEDGSFQLNLSYFDFLHAGRMTGVRFDRAFGGPARKPEDPVTERHCHVARSIQAVTEEVMLRLARHAGEITGRRKLCLAGGVALNCVANGRLLRESCFDSIWIQPAAGDSGGALGAALTAWHRHFAANESTSAKPPGDLMQGSLLGPEYSDEEILAVLNTHGAVYEELDRDALLETTVDLLLQEKVVAWFQGRMEFGPRALGNRSILGDPRSVRMQSQMNLKVKFRESFRPFAPAVLRDHVSECFELDTDSPYMLFVAPVRTELRRPPPDGAHGLGLLQHPHSTLPGITHVDYSARIQTVGPEQNPLFFDLLSRFHGRSGCPALINTSFNVRGEPIVCSPDDAYRCFRNTEIDVLVMGGILLRREQQPQIPLPRAHELVMD